MGIPDGCGVPTEEGIAVDIELCAIYKIREKEKKRTIFKSALNFPPPLFFYTFKQLIQCTFIVRTEQNSSVQHWPIIVLTEI